MGTIIRRVTAYEKGVIYNQENRLEHWNSGTVQFCKIPHPQLYIITMKKEEERNVLPLSSLHKKEVEILSSFPWELLGRVVGEIIRAVGEAFDDK